MVMNEWVYTVGGRSCGYASSVFYRSLYIGSAPIRRLNLEDDEQQHVNHIHA